MLKLNTACVRLSWRCRKSDRAQTTRTSSELQSFDHSHCASLTTTPRRASHPTMASNLPLRTSRIPAFQRQCLFQHRRHVQSPRAFSTTTPQLFASTVPRLRGQSLGQGDKNMTKSAVRGQSGPAPRVNMEKAQQDIGSLADDIGLLQDTIIRARFSQLPGPWSPRFWGYSWKLLKSKAMGLYS
jgi:protein MBA1